MSLLFKPLKIIDQRDYDFLGFKFKIKNIIKGSNLELFFQGIRVFCNVAALVHDEIKMQDPGLKELMDTDVESAAGIVGAHTEGQCVSGNRKLEG
jgi:hypothetical protein